MDFTIQKPEISIEELAQQIGYEPQFTDDSYIRPVAENKKFHLFVETQEDKLKFKLHLDKNDGEDHDCEYESERITKEVNRIKEIIFKDIFNK
ncbi:MAG: hypothetical protein V5A57_03610 [Candidatus Paceibacterota bacterium]